MRDEGKAVGEASLRDVETLWACELRSQRFGLTLIAAFGEWFAAKSARKRFTAPVVIDRRIGYERGSGRTVRGFAAQVAEVLDVDFDHENQAGV